VLRLRTAGGSRGRGKSVDPDLGTRTPSPLVNITRPTIHQHPLAYLIGLEGVALLKAFAGEYDAAFTNARLVEVRRLLDLGDELGRAVDVPPVPTEDGYDGWAPFYDDPENGLFAIEERHIRPILDTLPTGTVVDAACGTGRHSSYLHERGHMVIGVDASPGMLAIARKKLPTVRFEHADLLALPIDDDSTDAVLCSLALAHVEDLVPVFAEVARVLRPWGRYVVADTRGHFLGSRLYPLIEEDPKGNVGYMPTWRHATVEYLQAALAAGFRVRSVLEPMRPEPTVSEDDLPVPVEHPDLPPDIWSLHPWARDATNAAKHDDPALIIWDLELEVAPKA
jgi:ubiquinone/menaquinone biosynthesis C-methylase UbiE